MKTLMTRSLMGALCVVGGTATAVAGAVPAPPTTRGGVMLVADAKDFATQRDEYIRKAQDELQEWQNRMSQWTDDAKASGSKISEQTRRNLDKAWTDVQANWHKLQAAAPQTWDTARSSFEEASERMKSAWEKIQPRG
jgi:gas vesicle protein